MRIRLILRNNLPLVFLFSLLTVIFWFTRLWRFEELMTFHMDQALFLREIREMVDEQKLRLVGPPVISKIVLGRWFFIGPAFYYLLTPLAFLADWDAVSMTRILISVWWLAGLAAFWWLGKKFGWLAGLAVYGVVAAHPFLIDYGRLMWNPNFLPLIGIGFFWVLGRLLDKEKLWKWLGLGFIFGLGINFHYSAATWLIFLIPVLVWGIFRKKLRYFKIGALFILIGAIIGDLPLVIFDLRHDFYNLRTLWFFLEHGGVKETSGLSFGGYYLFAILPVILWLIALTIFFIRKRFGFPVALFAVLLLVAYCLSQVNWQARWGTGMPEGWNITKQKLVAKMICEEARRGGWDGRFEVAITISGDTRAGDLRWWLSREGCMPMAVEDYPKAERLYLVAYKWRRPETDNVWEVASLRPFKIAQEQSLGDKLVFYRLDRLPTPPVVTD